MKNIKDYNKSCCFNLQTCPTFNFNTVKKYDPYYNKIDEESNKNSFKSKLIQLDKEKFSNIPKNEKLMNNSTILNKNNFNYNKDKNYYTNLLNNIYQNESHFEHTNVKKKLNDSNLRISSLIPISKKMFNQSKGKIIKEEDIIKADDYKKKKRHSKRKGSFNEEEKLQISLRKKKTLKFNSTHMLVKVKKKSCSNIRKFSGIDKARDILREEKKVKTIIKKVKNDKEEDEKNNNDNYHNVHDKNDNNKKENNKNNIDENDNNKNNIDDNDNISFENKNEDKKDNNNIENNKIYGIKTEENNNKIILNNKKEENINEKINKNNNDFNNEINNNEKKNSIISNKKTICKEKETFDINNIETKNKNDIIKYKNKYKKAKKYRCFPFCCLTVNDDNSDND